jgi:hypothetical protein
MPIGQEDCSAVACAVPTAFASRFNELIYPELPLALNDLLQRWAGLDLGIGFIEKLWVLIEIFVCHPSYVARLYPDLS